MEQRVELTIFDPSGRVLMASDIEIEPGTSDFTPHNVFVPGLYVVSCITSAGNSQMHIARCIVQ
jgi:hypothetical protein